MPDLFFCPIESIVKQSVNGHDNTWCAEAALQSMFFHEGLLYRVQVAVAPRHALYGGNGHAIRLNCEHQAGACRFAIDKYRTAAANAMLAADVSTCQMQFVTEKV